MESEIKLWPRSEWPESLTEIPDSPRELYLRGAWPETEAYLAVVGSRKASQYALSAIDLLMRGLSGSSVTIISGLALGIDGAAHKAALKYNLPTVAVLGNGLDDSVLYPRTHTHLAKQILKAKGALISEYEPKAPAARWTFPARNRIVVGLASAVLIVEATEKSGTLITARLATDYNRDILALPHDIITEGGRGPNLLIRDGAIPILSSEDILEALGLETPQSVSASAADGSLLSLIDGHRTRDEIMRLNQADPSTTLRELTLLEINGKIGEQNGKLFRRS